MKRMHPMNEWKQPSLQWMKGTAGPMKEMSHPSDKRKRIHPPINEMNQPSNEYKESTLQWMKENDSPMNERK